MPINHDNEYHTEHPKPSDWYWMKPEEKKPYPESWQAAADGYELSEDVI